MPRQAAPSVASVLCPVDFSRPSRAALRTAASVARDTGAPLTVLFANDPLLVAAAAITLDERTIEQRTRLEVQRFVRNTMAGARLPHLRVVVAVGEPAPTIVDMARRLRSPLIVIGTEGLGGLGRLFFGSTTHEVVRRTHVPVVIVDAKTRLRAGSRWPGRRLLAPLDLGARSERDARIAAALARVSGASLVLVHVVTAAPPPSWYPIDRAVVERVRIARARSRLDAIATATGAEAQVLTGPLSKTIADAAIEGRADLVVMALRGGDGLLRSRPGRIAYDVACNAHVPVYVIAGGHGSLSRASR